jgi:hypothetical protein
MTRQKSEVVVKDVPIGDTLFRPDLLRFSVTSLSLLFPSSYNFVLLSRPV